MVNVKQVILTVKGRKVSYRIELNSKFTFIVGDSGTGKTSLDKMIDAELYHIDNPFKLIRLPSNESEGYELLERKKDEPYVLYFVDEDYRYIHNKVFQTTMLNTKGLFLIIRRNLFAAIPYASDDIIEFDKSSTHSIKRPYARATFQTVQYSKVNRVIIEDSKSGLSFFRAIFSNISSSNGKDNLRDMVADSKNTLFILDALGAGSIITGLIKTFEENRHLQNQLLLIDSFEAMVLQSEFLQAWVDPPINCANKEDYATKLLIEVMQRKGFSYSKEGKNPCLIADCCFNKTPCELCKYGEKLRLVAGAIYNDFKATSTKTDDELCLDIIKLPDTETQAILQLASQLSATFKSSNKSIDFSNSLSIQMHCQMLTSL